MTSVAVNPFAVLQFSQPQPGSQCGYPPWPAFSRLSRRFAARGGPPPLKLRIAVVSWPGKPNQSAGILHHFAPNMNWRQYLDGRFFGTGYCPASAISGAFFPFDQIKIDPHVPIKDIAERYRLRRESSGDPSRLGRQPNNQPPQRKAWKPSGPARLVACRKALPTRWQGFLPCSAPAKPASRFQATLLLSRDLAGPRPHQACRGVRASTAAGRRGQPMSPDGEERCPGSANLRCPGGAVPLEPWNPRILPPLLALSFGDAANGSARSAAR